MKKNARIRTFECKDIKQLQNKLNAFIEGCDNAGVEIVATQTHVTHNSTANIFIYTAVVYCRGV